MLALIKRIRVMVSTQSRMLLLTAWIMNKLCSGKDIFWYVYKNLFSLVSHDRRIQQKKQKQKHVYYIYNVIVIFLKKTKITTCAIFYCLVNNFYFNYRISRERICRHDFSSSIIGTWKGDRGLDAVKKKILSSWSEFQ